MLENKPEKKEPTAKLIVDHTKKQRYIIDYRSKKFYLGHGIRDTKTHTFYPFRKILWLANYLNIKQIKKSKQRANSKSISSNYWLNFSLEKHYQISEND